MDEKIHRKNMFLTDKIARKVFCVGGLFYPIIYPHLIGQRASLSAPPIGQTENHLSIEILAKKSKNFREFFGNIFNFSFKTNGINISGVNTSTNCER